MAQNSSLRLIALDTSTGRGSVALLDGRQIVAELRLLSLETHSARLLRSIRFLLQTAGWSLHQADLIAAGIGPGSFTGIRIGIATALGLAQTLEIPFAGVSGLDALAQQASFLEGPLGVIMDAQRGQVYYAEFVSGSGRIRRVQKAGLWHPWELKIRLGHKRLNIIGDGALRYIDDLKKPREQFPRLVEIDMFLAGSIGRLALNRRRSWCCGERLRSEPLYIRPPDARKPKG